MSEILKVYLSVALKFANKGETKKALKALKTMKKVLRKVKDENRNTNL